MGDYHCLDTKTTNALQDVANKLRIHSITSTDATKSGHPTSCASAAEIVSVLFFRVMRYSVKQPRAASNDRFIMSKGHAAPLLYAAWAEAGLFPVEDLSNLRKITSDLEGHPTPRLNFVDVATGSLGQGLSCAAGMAYVGKYIDQASYRTYCLIGDGESAEGSIWEAMAFASKYRLDNLVAVFDVNRLGQSEATSLGHDIDSYRLRAEAFGFNVYVVDGHNIESLVKAFHDAEVVKEKPTAIIAKTFKGQGFVGIANEENWHGKPLAAKSAEVLAHLRKQLTGEVSPCPMMPAMEVAEVNARVVALSRLPSYNKGDKVATRQAFGTGLAKLAESDPRVISLDADTKNSTFAIKVLEARPKQFIECFIAEQNMVGVGVGAACRNRTIPFVSTFACFLSRAFDQMRMAAISQSNINLCGSHCGISIGEDGPSQMALEDLALFRAIPTCTVFYPSDAVSTERAVELAANTKGITFIRTSRPACPVIYNNDEEFVVGQSKIVRHSDSDKVTVIGAAVTLFEALKAADILATEGISIRVIDPFTVKPLDVAGISKAVQETGGRVVVVEDHYAEGGLGEAVLSALSSQSCKVRHLAVGSVPRSGPSQMLLELFGIDCNAIVVAVKSLL